MLSGVPGRRGGGEPDDGGSRARSTAPPGALWNEVVTLPVGSVSFRAMSLFRKQTADTADRQDDADQEDRNLRESASSASSASLIWRTLRAWAILTSFTRGDNMS